MRGATSLSVSLLLKDIGFKAKHSRRWIQNEEGVYGRYDNGSMPFGPYAYENVAPAYTFDTLWPMLPQSINGPFKYKDGSVGTAYYGKKLITSTSGKEQVIYSRFNSKV